MIPDEMNSNRSAKMCPLEANAGMAMVMTAMFTLSHPTKSDRIK